MAITKADVKLMASQELSDNDSGGGAMTGNEIVDGNVNNLFADISRLDRTIGRVSLRKAFPAIQTANTDVYYGGHVILTDPTDDPGVSVTIFSTNDYSDRRTDARDHMESYVVRSVLSRARLYEKQLSGQKTVLLVQKPGLDIPEIGDVYLLIQDEGLASEFEQFVKVSSVEVSRQTFTDSAGDYKMDVITLGISDALRYTFIGGVPDRYDVTAQAGDAAVFRRTSVADASKYYGVTKLAQAISNGDLTFQVDSIYAYIVPSAQSEVPLADLSPGGDSIREVASGTNAITVNSTCSASGSLYAGLGMVRGSVTLTYGSSTWVDNGAGGFTRTAGTFTYEPTVIDYTTGEINTGSSALSWQIDFTPAAPITDIADTDEIGVTLGNRATTYVKTLNPVPAPGSLMIDYMALGKWYRLRDQGDGSARGDGEYGVASINYATGTVTITLAALPDVDTSILFTWGGGQHYDIRDDDVNIQPPAFYHTVADGSIIPNSLTITYTSNSTQYTLTDDGVGLLSGTGGTGKVDYVTGQIYVEPSEIPDSGSNITYDFDTGTFVTETFTPTASAGDINLTLASTAIMAGTVSVHWETTHSERAVVNEPGWRFGPFSRSQIVYINNSIGLTIGRTVLDDGAGAFESATGTINYGTGALTMTVEQGVSSNVYNPSPSSRLWVEETISDVFTDGSTVTVKYFETGVGPTTRQEVVSVPALEVTLSPLGNERIVEGSIQFTLNGVIYVDRSGSLYRDIDHTNNAGTLAGEIDYASGIASVTDWDIGTNTLTNQSLLVQYGDWSMYDVRFRTAGAPLQPSSFYIQANKITDSSLVSDTADANGDLSTADIEGYVNIENGIARVKFGRWVVAAGNEGEDWYDTLELDGQGNVWQPEPVDPNTLRYNAVAYSYIPIDASLIGVDPVRLPSDGRVPIFRSGDVCVIHNTTSEAMPSGLIADQVVNLTGGPYDLVELYDQNGVQVDHTLYTVDLTAGTVTMGNPLDLSGYTEPLVAMERIEDMLMISDVQISGQISVASGITHDYPANTTFVSSALLMSDMGSRYYSFFSQATWTGNWLDSREGNNTTAQYNEVNYPVLLRNDGAIEERWALIFTSATAFDIVGETVGQIGSGVTDGAPGTYVAPTNPQSGQPYFSIATDGFGGGWATGNVIRFNTESANFPVWFARTTLPGPEVEPTDEFTVQIRGDAD
jgi:hypothetical protein